MPYRRRIDGKITAYRTRNLVRGLFMLCLVLLAGTMGYMLLEKWQFLDALYMTVITITTVGYGEVREVSEPGRVYTVFLIFMGMGIMAYTVGMVAQAMVEFQLLSLLGRKKLGLKVKSIKDHYIICGYGRIGRIITRELKAGNIPLLVIEEKPELKNELEDEGIPYIIGDATSEDLLMEAGIERARGLVAVVLSDADNLFITMTARGLKPNIHIVARADEEKTRKKLLRAGADRVVMPYLIGGQKMAHTIIKPAVTDFLELTVHGEGIELKMEELPVEEGSRLVGVNLIDSGIRQEMNIIIVAISKKDGEMTFNPSSHTRIEAGDTLIALGHNQDLMKLAAALSESG
jgi:voltage-gated potassium channel